MTFLRIKKPMGPVYSIACFTFLSLSANGMAQNQIERAKSGNGTPPDGTIVNGTLERIDTGSGDVDVKNNNGTTKTFNAAAARILNGKGEIIDMADMRTGERVDLNVVKKNQVTMIRIRDDQN